MEKKTQESMKIGREAENAAPGSNTPGRQPGEKGEEPGQAGQQPGKEAAGPEQAVGETHKTDVKSMTLPELESWLSGMGEKPFRAKQLFDWIHNKQASSFSDMTNLSKALREKLEKEAGLVVLKAAKVETSGIDGTRKYLFETEDGNFIESVRMTYSYGMSACISSQIGCAMGCRFCASTIGGVVRSLTAAEMLDQVYRIQADSPARVSHVVVMGMGEPFDNYDELVRFLHLVTAKEGMGLSARNLTVSTCGIVPGIRRFAKEGMPVTLALSLHASNQKAREEMMPIARKYPLDEVLDACRYYFRETGRRVTYEYSMVNGVNDSPENAEELGRLLGHQGAHVNLIPMNPVREKTWRQSPKEAISRFKMELENYGINVTIRREMGRDIDGACGQLRKRYTNQIL